VPIIYAQYLYWYWYLKVTYWYWYWYLFVEYLIQDCSNIIRVRRADADYSAKL